MIFRLITLLLLSSMIACQAQKTTKSVDDSSVKEMTEYMKSDLLDFPDAITAVVKTEEEWKEQLSEMEYYVLRQAGTERSFTGPFVNNKKEGVYTCGGCSLPLFDSKTKFKSGTGWPSYYEPIRDNYIKEDVDYKIGYKRVEVLCARCDGHLGHVFEDGPNPTGLRYCINGASLDFVEKSK